MGKIYHQYMYAYPHKTAYYPLEKRQIAKQLAALGGRESGLYLHIPFCEVKCDYCNLFSIAGGRKWIPAYIQAVGRQIAQYSQVVDLHSIHFSSFVIGGGTPVLLSRHTMEELLSVIEGAFRVTPENVDSCIELAPNQTTLESIGFLKECGFHRISVGIQSLQEEELRILGRVHSAKRCMQILPLIADADFPLWNLDLIYGLPGQTWETFGDSLRRAVEYSPTEIFLYPLYVKPHTLLYGRIETDEAMAITLYRRACAFLLEKGYVQVSMRRFTLHPPKRVESGCGFEQNLAIGCGGRSYLGNLHFCEPFAVEPSACIATLKEFCQKKDFFSGLVGWILDSDEQRRRYVIKNLLHCQGISLKDYYQRFSSNLLEDFDFLMPLLEKGLVTCEDSCLRLTSDGLAFSDAIGPQFISPIVAAHSAEFYKEGRNNV